MTTAIVQIEAPVGIFYVDNFYSEDELKDIMYELQFLVKGDKLLPPERTGSARTQEGLVIKKNKAIFLDGAYTNRSTSDILRINRKLFQLDIKAVDPTFKMLRECNSDSTLISYYEDADYYKPHLDYCILTALTYFYEEPKKFSGGDVYLPEYGITLECVHNRTYLIPSLVEHEVSEVRMAQDDMGKGLGRFCMAQFLTFRS